MKKTATLLVFLAAISTGAYAQGLSGGVKAGLNLANQTFKSSGYTVSPSMLPSFYAGAYVTFMFSEHLGLQPEVLLSGQGAKSGDDKLKLTYINVPILIRYNVNSVLSFHVGPQIGVLASAKEKFNGGTEDVKDGYKSTDLGVAVGANVDIKKLNFTFRFVKGLSNVAESDPDFGDVTIKNYMIQLGVGFTLFGTPGGK